MEAGPDAFNDDAGAQLQVANGEESVGIYACGGGFNWEMGGVGFCPLSARMRTKRVMKGLVGCGLED